MAHAMPQLSPAEARRRAQEVARQHIERLKEFNKKHPHPEAAEPLMPLDESALELYTDSLYGLLIARGLVAPAPSDSSDVSSNRKLSS